jgi:hypothetical protein
MLGVVVPYALSVHSFVDKVGGYAGLAAVVAVALLVIMFFVNARETSALRHRAAEAEERLYRLEYYAEQVNRNAAAQAAPPAATETAAPPATAGAAPVPAPAPAAAAAAGAAKTGLPFAPVGVGAPALASATRLIPLPEVAPSGRAAAAAAPAASSIVLQPTEAVPALTNGDDNGAELPVAPPPSTVAAGGPPATETADAEDLVPAPPPRLTRTPPPVAPRRNYGRDGKGSRVGKGSFAVAALLLAIIIAAAVLVISRHNNSNSTPTANRTHHHRTHHKASGAKHSKTTNSPTATKTKTVRVNPSTVTVAVLNGTSTDNLAADVLGKLTTAGFVGGQTGNNPDQTETATTIGYLPGKRNQALAVASALKLQQTDVKPVPTDSRAVVCSTPTTCPEQVVVVVGADLASQT